MINLKTASLSSGTQLTNGALQYVWCFWREGSFIFIDLGRRAIYFHGSGEKGHLFSRIWGEGSFIFMDLGRRAIYFHGSGEKGHLFS